MSNQEPQAEKIFAGALELADDAKRRAYIECSCAGNEPLMQEVKSLLAAHEKAGTFLERPADGAALGGTASEPTGTGTSMTLAEQPGDRIDRYKLLEKIGEGGFGDVWMAEQQEPVRRRVALKIIKLGMDTKEVVARFEAERQALALMEHPNIAKVFDGGATETGRPYFVMELVRGIRITEFCDQQSLSTEERLKLFIQVCKAVQHAHQKGVIHRDLKPSNVLVPLHDTTPVPKIIDFGIAKAVAQPLTEKTFFTRFHHFVGTPAYMSPEQAGMSDLDMDTRSDIYSLGVLLYELLTGKTPFDAEELLKAGFDEMRRVIREKEPVKPSTRLTRERAATPSTKSEIRNPRSEIDPDLDWIVMKCLEKDRRRRYDTANGLAADIQRHLNHEAVVARPPGNVYRFQKLVRRNRVVFAAGGAVSVVLIAGLAASLLLLFKERAAHRRAVAAEQAQTILAQDLEGKNRDLEEEKKIADERFREACLAQARALRWSGRAGRRFEGLDALAKAAAIRPDLDLRNEAIALLALHDMRAGKQFPGSSNATPAAAPDSPRGRFARVDRAGNISIRHLDDDIEVARLPGFGNMGVFLRFSADGRFLAAKYDPLPKARVNKSVLLVWDVEQQKPVLGLTNALVDVAAGFHPRQPIIAVGQRDEIVNLYDLPSGRFSKTLRVGARPHSVQFNPEGDMLAISSNAKSMVMLVDWAEGNIIHKLQHQGAEYGVHEGGAHGIAWHPDGHVLASSGPYHIYLWNARDGQLLGTFSGQMQPVNVGFDPSGDFLISAGWESTVYLWDALRREPLVYMPGKGACFDCSGYLPGFTAEGNTLKLLELAVEPVCRTLVAKTDVSAVDAAFSPDGRVLAVTAGGGVVLWDISRRFAANYIGLQWGRSVQFTADGRDLFVSAKSALERWPMVWENSDHSVLKLGPPERFSVPKSTDYARLIPGSRRVALSGAAVVLDLDQPAKRITLAGNPRTAISASPDGRWLAAGGWPPADSTSVWDAQTGEHVRELLPPPQTPMYALFSPDRQWLLVGAKQEYTLFAVGTWEVIRRFPSDPTITSYPVAFSPDACLVAIRRSATEIQLLHPADGREIARLPGEQPEPLCFSPDGTLLVVCDAKKTMRVWDLRLVREGLARLNLDWDLPPYPLRGPVETNRFRIQIDRGNSTTAASPPAEH